MIKLLRRIRIKINNERQAARRRKDRSLQQISISDGTYTRSYTDKYELQKFLNELKPVKTQYKLIRLGPPGDGGYLVPDDLAGIKYCFSPGVSNKAFFEEALIDRGVKSFLADYSVNHPPIDNDMVVFDKKFLGITDDEQFMTLEYWIKKYLPNNHDDLILQMDIEGAEYAVLEHVSPSLLNNFRVMVIEFHKFFHIVDEKFFHEVRDVFKKLTDAHHVVHIHPNNCCGTVVYKDLSIPRTMEFTFLRKDRSSVFGHVDSFPNKLDSRNVRSKPDLTLPECWYKKIG